MGHRLARSRPLTLPQIWLHGVEIRRIGGQALDVEPRALAGHVARHAAAPVGGQPVPEQDDGAAAEVPLEGPQERDQPAIGVGAWARLEEEPAAPAIPAEGQRDGDREPLPESAGVGQDGGPAPRRPRPPDHRVVREAALVLEEEPGPAAPGVFVTRGHRVRFHGAMAAASRSRACRTGRCQGSPNVPPDVVIEHSRPRLGGGGGRLSRPCPPERRIPFNRHPVG